MEPQIANPHHADLDLARGKESFIWALKLSKKLSKDMELTSTPTAPNSKEIKFKTSPPLFIFIFGQYLP